MSKLKFVFLVIFVSLSTLLFAQIPTLPSNLSNTRSSDVSEEQLTQIKSYLGKNGLSTQSAYELFLSKGMVPAEATTLKLRLDASNPSGIGNGNLSSQNDRSGRERTDTTNRTRVSNPKKIFGLEIFNNGVLSFEPNLSIATPVRYIIGPNDEININIYGYQEAKHNLKVGPEGEINIPFVGVMYVAGLTIEQATAKIKNKLSTSGYANIKTGLTKVNVTIGRIRSIKVTILGEVRNPGSYTWSILIG